MLLTQRKFFAVADSRHSARRNSQRREVVFGRLRALGAKCDVVILRAALVAIAFDLHVGIWMRLQPARIGTQHRTVLRLDRVIIISEMDIRERAALATDRSVLREIFERILAAHLAAGLISADRFE